MAKAEWNGATLAESADTIVVEGNHYFPPLSINSEYFTDSTRSTVCPWKGTASYYDVVVEGERNSAAAWYYADPKAAAGEIEGYIAFWGGVKVSSN